MNEAWGVMIAAVSIGVFGLVLLGVSFLALPSHLSHILAFAGRITTAASVAILLVSFWLRFTFVGILDYVLMFGFPLLGVIAGVISIRQFSLKNNAVQ